MISTGIGRDKKFGSYLGGWISKNVGLLIMITSGFGSSSIFGGVCFLIIGRVISFSGLKINIW